MNYLELYNYKKRQILVQHPNRIKNQIVKNLSDNNSSETQ